MGNSTRETDAKLSSNHTHEMHTRLRFFLNFCRPQVLIPAIGMVLIIFTFLIPGSGMFSDDYGYLRKSAHYSSGDFTMGGAKDKQNQWSGILYPLSIAAWRVAKNPATRIQLAFLSNIIMFLLGLALLFSAITKLKSIEAAAAFVIAYSIQPIFFYPNFFVLTENLLFLCIAAVLWALTSPKLGAVQIFAIVLSVVLSPLVRPSGLALPGALALVWLLSERKKSNSWKVIAATSSLVLYLGFASLFKDILGGSREGRYFTAIKDVFEHTHNLKLLTGLAFSHLSYVFYASGVFFLPIGLSSLYLNRRNLSPRLKKLCVYSLSLAVLFFIFCLLHMVLRISLDKTQTPTFIYGRYCDPVILALALPSLIGIWKISVFRDRRILSSTTLILAALFPVFAIYGRSFSGINLIGLSAAGSLDLFSWLLIVMAIGAFIFKLILLSPGHVPKILWIWSIIFGVLGISAAWENVVKQAKQVEQSLEPAQWLMTREDERFSKFCVAMLEPNLQNQNPARRKRMSNVLHAVEFAVFPNAVTHSNSAAELPTNCFVLTRVSLNLAPLPPRAVLWANKNFILWDAND